MVRKSLSFDARSISSLGQLTVLVEALQRYEQNLLPRSMRLWVEAMLDIDPDDPVQPLLPGQPHSSQS